jgi:hypothetical protein
MAPSIGEFAAMRHGELMGNPVDHITAETQVRQRQELA